MPIEPLVRRWLPNLRRSRRWMDGLYIGLIAALMAGAGLLVHATGGTKLAWPYLMLVPVLLAAARFRVIGGLLGGLAGGLILGPFMPLDVAASIPQDTANWLVRLAFYTGLGGFTGLLFRLIQWESEQRAAEARIDSDSGLPNKTALIEYLDATADTQTRAPLLLLVRVTSLPEIIQAIGIRAGDQVMQELARRFRSHVGDPLDIYRFSASELMLVRPAPMQTAEQMADQVLRSVATPIEARNVPVHVELIMGSADGAADTPGPRELLRRARIALAEARDLHRHHCAYQPEHERESAKTVELLGRVRESLARGHFELHFQPKVRAHDRAVAGCEGLIRWRRNGGDLIPPGLFMPGVERSALIDPLTRFVADQASSFTGRLDGQHVSINFSARNLLDESLIDRVGRALDEAGIGHDRLEVEITESAFVSDPQAARRAITRLREQGFRVSIDDFGTGYSSFEYLRLLPITGLKIDRAFVNDLEHDERARDLMTCMIQVGHALDLEVVAEGVETPAQMEILRDLGCDLIQGFLFARPMPGPDYLSWCGSPAG